MSCSLTTGVKGVAVELGPDDVVAAGEPELVVGGGVVLGPYNHLRSGVPVGSPHVQHLAVHGRANVEVAGLTEGK